MTVEQARHSKLTIGLCLLAAVMEGFDLQAAGVVAAGIRTDFGLTPGQLGLFFSAATAGLIVGALIGGRIADAYGRKLGLVTSLALFGVFSLATGLTDDFATMLVARLLTGVGLGGAMPNLVAIAAEAADPRRRATAVAVMFAGIPLGGALAGLFAMSGLYGTGEWRVIFVVGGVAPLLLVPVLMKLLPPLIIPPVPAAQRGETSLGRALFGRETILATVTLWLASFLSLLILYLILNWLPSLLVSRGFTPGQAGLVQLVFNVVGALAGIFIGKAMDGRGAVAAVVIVYATLVAALLFFAMLPTDMTLAVLAAAILGPGLLGAQALLYGLSPKCYPDWARGTGVGASVAVGRLGSVTGPLLAGGLVATGSSAGGVLAVLVPIAAVAGLAALLLTWRIGRLHPHSGAGARSGQ